VETLTNDEVIFELKNIQRLNYTLASDEFFKKAIKCVRKVDMLETMVREYRQEGRKPHRTITMEDLAKLLGMKEGEAE
jgi:nitrogen fixation/metabolism regulation signal transduction histidine kinase